MGKYSQKGGAIRMPYRWFDDNAQAFKPCKNGACGQKVVYGGKPKNGQDGGAIAMPYRWFNPMATPFHPCRGCRCGQCNCKANKGQQQQKDQRGGAYDYYNDFGCQSGNDYNSSGLTYPGCAEERAHQRGGNAVGAPFYIFTPGQPLPEHFPMKRSDRPTFVKVPHNRFWATKY